MLEQKTTRTKCNLIQDAEHRSSCTFSSRLRLGQHVKRRANRAAWFRHKIRIGKIISCKLSISICRYIARFQKEALPDRTRSTTAQWSLSCINNQLSRIQNEDTSLLILHSLKGIQSKMIVRLSWKTSFRQIMKKIYLITQIYMYHCIFENLNLSPYLKVSLTSNWKIQIHPHSPFQQHQRWTVAQLFTYRTNALEVICVSNTLYAFESQQQKTLTIYMFYISLSQNTGNTWARRKKAIFIKGCVMVSGSEEDIFLRERELDFCEASKGQAHGQQLRTWQHNGCYGNEELSFHVKKPHKQMNKGAEIGEEAMNNLTEISYPIGDTNCTFLVPYSGTWLQY